MPSLTGLKFVLCALLFSLHGSIFSQVEPVYRHFSVHEGLSSRTIFDLLQTEDQRIWFGTSNSLSVYNGSTFKTFSDLEGTSFPSVIKIYKSQKKHRLWLIPRFFQPFAIDNERVIQYPFNLTSVKGVVSTFYEDDKGNLHMGTSSRGYSIAHPPPNCGMTQVDTVPGKLCVREHGNQLFYYGTRSVTGLKFQVTYETEKGINIEDVVTIKSPRHLNGIRVNDSISLISYGFDLITFCNGKITAQQTFPRNIISLSKCGSEVWLGLYKGGTINYSVQGQQLVKIRHLLPDYSITRVLQDHENGYWFSTLEDGAFYTANLEILYYDLPHFSQRQEGVLHIAKHQGEMLIGNSSGFIGVFQADTFKRSIDLNKRLTPGQPVTSILYYPPKKEFRISLQSGKTVGYRNQKLRTNVNYIALIDNQFLQTDSTSFLTYCHDPCILHYKNDTIHKKYPLKRKGKNMAIGLQGEPLFVTHDGVYTLFQDRLKKIDFNGWEYANLIKNFGDSLLLINSSNKGVMVKTRDSQFVFDQHKGYLNQAVLDQNGNFWLAMHGGLFLLKKQNKGWSFQKISKGHGIKGQNIKDLLLDQDHLWVGTDEGLSRFNVNALPRVETPMPRVTQLVSGDTVFKTDSTLNLPAQFNHLQFHFHTVSFRSDRDITYEYQLHPINETPLTTQANNAHYSELPPGNYTFTVRAKGGEDDWSALYHYSFSIAPPFWKTTGFIVLMVMVVLAFLAGIIYFIAEWIQKREAKKGQVAKMIADLKLQSLQAQFNPHFTFNTLNSIQGYMAKNNMESAREYLALFSSLMRSILLHSKKTELLIADELSMLTKYLELENMRLESPIVYSFDLDQSIDPDFDRIPPMLLQPTIENAINHGLFEKTGDRRIRVTLRLINNTLICTVEDNGIGRKASKQVQLKKKRTGTGKGLKLIHDRLQMLPGSSLNIIDLTDASGRATGTRVIIQIKLHD